MEEIRFAVAPSIYHFDKEKTTNAPEIEAIVVLNLAFFKKFFIKICKK